MIKLNEISIKKWSVLFLFSVVFAGGIFSVKAQNPQTKKENPAAVLTSYYDAVNSKQYRKAYDYWRNPPQSYREFVRGYSDTRNVRLIINPNNMVEGGAGSLYKEVPTVLISTMKNGSRQMFSGCYTLRKINLRPPDIPKEDAWHIDRGELRPAPLNSSTAKLLAQACGGSNTTLPDDGKDDKTSRILGILGFDSQTAEESISVPENIQANRDFEITVTTSGNGCISAGEASVILGENNADVFVYDFTSANRPGIACTMILKTLPHKATLRFTKKGEAVIRVWGRQSGGNPVFGEPVVVEKRVTVR